MAARGSLNFVELHVEKLLLGLAAAFAIAVAVYYLMGPNKVEYGGSSYGPGQLDEVIVSRAQDLQRAVRNASVEVPKVPEYARQLRDDFQTGIFGDKEAVPETLRVASYFGSPVPELKVGTRTTIKNLELVTPLPPTAPVMNTGISLVNREQAVLAREPGAKSDIPQTEPVERSWVSGAVYFPSAAQVRDMIAAGYEGYRAKVYVAGVDVERQEMTADGQFADWSDVDLGMAMPKLDIPTPVFDDRSGTVLNQAELDSTLQLVRNSQVQIMEPEFYNVLAGDLWEMPPLPGHGEDDEEEAPGGGVPPVAEPRDPPGGGVPPGIQPPGRGQPPQRGGGLQPPQRGGGLRPPGRPSTEGKAEARRAIKQNLTEAQRALRDRNWQEAIQKAQAVIANEHATRVNVGQAQRIVQRAQAELDREAGAVASPQPVRSGTMNESRELVTNPSSTDHDPALWFHDDSVEPGKTYRYRTRVKLWNRYVGKRAVLRDPSDAGNTVLAGEWSLPSTPITVAPKTHFFVTGEGGYGTEGQSARVDVFVWHAGDWYKENFVVQIGDVVGDVREVKTNRYDEFGTTNFARQSTLHYRGRRARCPPAREDPFPPRAGQGRLLV